ncbi:ORF133 [Leucania separata nucleopolyhedrovirus]|uniref:ORF133 n=1 Tax=Leucania separata nucleopolyhedrovirus TaxID=1307956 RepID=Q0IKY6_NPVLS|nr:ORF133 [Leucania separata nucleopolyhedrovirus]AAR28897.1 ORF133 [Leucania separata nucleopolyhedrovirus]
MAHCVETLGQSVDTMETYASLERSVKKHNFIQCLMNRELGKPADKLNISLSLQQPFVLEARTRQGLRMLNQFKCPVMLQADAIHWCLKLHRANHQVSRCRLCRRVLHPLNDMEMCICGTCRIGLVEHFRKMKIDENKEQS